MAINNTVYNTKTGKKYKIHPAFVNDEAYKASRGLVIQPEIKPFQVTNMEAKEATEPATDEPGAEPAVAEPIPSTSPKVVKTKSSK